MKSIFEQEVYNEVLERINLLSSETKAQWGQMNVAQMLSHCQNPLLVALGRKELKKPNFLMRLLYKSFKSAMYNDKLWKKNLGTPKEYKVVADKEFYSEKTALLGLIDDFYEERNKERSEPHPVFGHFTHDQWGMLQYKHLDHHLRQFGV